VLVVFIFDFVVDIGTFVIKYKYKNISTISVAKLYLSAFLYTS